MFLLHEFWGHCVHAVGVPSCFRPTATDIWGAETRCHKPEMRTRRADQAPSSRPFSSVRLTRGSHLLATCEEGSVTVYFNFLNDYSTPKDRTRARRITLGDLSHIKGCTGYCSSRGCHPTETRRCLNLLASHSRVPNESFFHDHDLR